MSALVICVQTTFYHFRQFSRKGTWVLLLRALHQAERCRVGKDPHPSVAIMDAQSVKTVEESAHISGFDGHKRVKGRKRHLLVDTLGIPISYYVTPANMHDTQGARRLLAGLNYFVPRLKTIWADQAYPRARIGEVVPSTGWMGPRGCRALIWCSHIKQAGEEVDCRTHIWLALSKPPHEQGLRAQGTNQRNAH